jgi:hypothetical protein
VSIAKNKYNFYVNCEKGNIRYLLIPLVLLLFLTFAFLVKPFFYNTASQLKSNFPTSTDESSKYPFTFTEPLLKNSKTHVYEKCAISFNYPEDWVLYTDSENDQASRGHTAISSIDDSTISCSKMPCEKPEGYSKILIACYDKPVGDLVEYIKTQNNANSNMTLTFGEISSKNFASQTFLVQEVLSPNTSGLKYYLEQKSDKVLMISVSPLNLSPKLESEVAFVLSSIKPL